MYHPAMPHSTQALGLAELEPQRERPTTADGTAENTQGQPASVEEMMAMQVADKDSRAGIMDEEQQRAHAAITPTQ